MHKNKIEIWNPFLIVLCPNINILYLNHSSTVFLSFAYISIKYHLILYIKYLLFFTIHNYFIIFSVSWLYILGHSVFNINFLTDLFGLLLCNALCWPIPDPLHWQGIGDPVFRHQDNSKLKPTICRLCSDDISYNAGHSSLRTERMHTIRWKQAHITPKEFLAWLPAFQLRKGSPPYRIWKPHLGKSHCFISNPASVSQKYSNS